MKKKFSLMIKVMTTVTFTTVVLILSFSYLMEKMTEKNLEESANVQTKTLINSIKLTTADYIWNLNNAALKTVADKLVEDESIDSIEFLDSKEKILASAQEEEKITSLSYKQTTIKSDIFYGKDNQKIGFIVLKYNLNTVKEFKSKLIVYIIFAVIIVLVIICGALYLIMHLTNKTLDEEFSKLKNISDTTFNSSRESSDFSQAVSQSTTQQAAAIQETVATLHQITEMVNTSVASATKSSEHASVSFDSAKLGQQVVKEMITSMKEIDDSNSSIMSEVNKSNDRIKDIVNVINEISTKTAVINDIVFQTKLLSFNASVEAARAGEHGKGFAVVAEEVGNLAQMSGNAAKEISGLIDQSISRVNQIIEETNTGVERVIKTGSLKIEQGVKTAEKCDQVLSDIVETAIVVKNMMNEVALASKEQSIGVQNISQAMTQVDQMVHANENSASKSFLTAQKLLEQSNELKIAVTNIENEIFGKKLSSASDAPSVKKEKPKKVEKAISKEAKKDEVKKSEIKKPVLAIVKKEEVKAAPKAEKETPKKVKDAVKEVAKETKTNQASESKLNQNVVPLSTDNRFEDV